MGERISLILVCSPSERDCPGEHQPLPVKQVEEAANSRELNGVTFNDVGQHAFAPPMSLLFAGSWENLDIDEFVERFGEIEWREPEAVMLLYQRSDECCHMVHANPKAYRKD